jgi:hypothetical protein
MNWTLICLLGASVASAVAQPRRMYTSPGVYISPYDHYVNPAQRSGAFFGNAPGGSQSSSDPRSLHPGMLPPTNGISGVFITNRIVYVTTAPPPRVLAPAPDRIRPNPFNRPLVLEQRQFGTTNYVRRQFPER